MKKELRLSHSGAGKFTQCPRKWYLHYIEKLRSPKMGSALFFGNALDDAFSRLLLDKKSHLTEDEKLGLKFTPEQIFANKMVEAKNDAGQIVQLPKSNLADYYTSDFDAALFSNETVALVAQMEKSLDKLSKIVAFHEECKSNLNPRNKQKRRLTDDEYVLYNYINWLSLNEKGKLMLEAYKRQVFPHISEVSAIQKEIEIPNGDGDSIVGKIDLVASFIDKPKQQFICDNKTSSQPYKDDSVATSEQLATYCEAEGNFNAAYLVVEKKIRAKEPKVRTQVIKGTVGEELLQKTFDNYENVRYAIASAGDDMEAYPQNFNSCFDFGKICQYFQMCKHNSKGNLISCKVEKKNV